MSDISLTGSDIARLRLAVIFYSSKTREANITRHKRIELRAIPLRVARA